MPRCPNPRCQLDYPPGSFQCTNPSCQCILPEAVVAGRYRIETLIGLGGMGAVYRASDTFEIQQVALKVLSLVKSSMDLPTAIERFRREARYARQLQHKNIVPVLNFGQDGTLLYLAMPLVTGGTLKGLLKKGQPLPTPKAQQYLNDLAAALDAIHAHPQEIVHRDIKPSNLLIHQDDGRLVVADFGIARAMQQEKALTQRGWALGTEHYIAPEQQRGKPEPASDVYSMGVVAYQMFTGLLPYQAVIKSQATEIPAPSSLNSTLPPAADAVLLRAIDVDPTRRYSSARAFADALNDALQSSPSASIIGKANIIIHTIIPENPCGKCGRENRSSSRFCRYCGQRLDDTSPLVTEVCEVGYVSDKGRHAQENEDMLLVVHGLCTNLAPPPRPFSLLAVADGLRGTEGKSRGGRDASRLAIDTVADTLLSLLSAVSPLHNTPQSTESRQLSRFLQASPPSEEIVARWLREAVQQANRVIYHCNADYDIQMASTLTAALLYKRHLYVASVGDSRAYHYNVTKGLQRITTDHTLVANLVETDLLKPDEVYTSTKRHQHYHSLGQAYHVTVDVFEQEVEPNDLILLCTDGLWHMVHDEDLAELLSQGGDPQQLARTLVDAANNAGGEGNVSVIAAAVQ
jgi:serine/threonine protein kinase